MIMMMVISQSLSSHYTSSQSNQLVGLHHSSLPSSYLVVSAISKCRNFACKSLYLRVRPGDDDDDDDDHGDDIYDDDDIYDRCNDDDDDIYDHGDNDDDEVCKCIRYISINTSFSSSSSSSSSFLLLTSIVLC